MANASAATGKDPGKALLLAWLVPGAGHWYCGRRGRATLYGLTVAGVFVGGLVMGGLSLVSVLGHKWAFLLQIFDGPIAIVAALANHPDLVSFLDKMFQTNVVQSSPSRLADLGLTYTLVSAAFNVLVMADAYYLADKPLEGAPEGAEENAS